MAAGMKVEIKGNQMIITCPLTDPTPSKSGKTELVYSTYGAKVTELKVKGKPVSVNLNAYIPA